jgi:hypothetical protein
MISTSDKSPSRDGTSPRMENPYLPKPSYKDALLATVSDDTNRMGVNTFKLIHLLKKTDHRKETEQVNDGHQEDDSSRTSENTATKTNTVELRFYRMRFQFTIDETSPDTYLEDVANHVNKIMEVINLNTPGVRLVPWHKSGDIKKEELVTTISDEALEIVKYLYGFKAGLNKAGSQYLRILLAFPSQYSADDIVKKE